MSTKTISTAQVTAAHFIQGVNGAFFRDSRTEAMTRCPRPGGMAFGASRASDLSMSVQLFLRHDPPSMASRSFSIP